ncbi:MAG TPA: PAS domain S-box protein [Burkholderiaceae bacterium]|nr:PAS domain S-box protein [Burkholderiaceae bacterium]
MKTTELPEREQSARTCTRPQSQHVPERWGHLLAALDAHAIVSMTDAAGTITHVNDRFCAVSGYSREELLGRNHRILKSGLHDRAFYDGMWGEITAGRTWHGEICNRRKDGSYYWVQATIAPFGDAGGLPMEYVSIRTEITATKETARQAREAEERYHLSQNFANIGTWDWDIATGDLYWSERIGPLFGYPAGEIATTYTNFLAAVHPDDRDRVIAALTACIETGVEYAIEHRCVWPDGTVRWMLERGDVIRGPDGRPARMLGVVQDITDRIHAQEQAAVFRRLVDSTEQGIGLADAQSGRLQYVNNAATRILRRSRAELLGKRLRDFAAPHTRRSLREIDAATREHRTWTGLLPIVRGDGYEIVLKAGIGSLDVDGEVRHFFSMFGDHSDEVAREAELRRAYWEAERANRIKSDFLSRMSHELRTPLNAVMGYAQILELEGDLTERQFEQVGAIFRAGEHLLQLINDLLGLASIESGDLSLSIEPVSGEAVVADCVSLLAPVALKHNIAITTELDPSLRISADRMRLKQAVINLLSNAVKYNRAGGRVTVRLRPASAGLGRIEVQDTGPGMPADQLPNLFKPFMRLEGSRHVEGTGIGLAITRQLLTLMGGEVGVKSELGVGSTFWIQLPLALARDSAAEAPGG